CLGPRHRRDRPPRRPLGAAGGRARQHRVLHGPDDPAGGSGMNLAAAEYRAVQRASANDTVVRHSDLVRRIAHHLAARLPASVEIDDLIQSGMIGLIEASRSYDPEQGASFETYASIRIRGSMIDDIRRGDWVPRSVH